MELSISKLIELILIGITQGATEFIPVSSSGHLEIIPVLFGWDKPSTIIILFAHLGTLLALVYYFRKDLLQYAKSLFSFVKQRGTDLSAETKHDLRIIKLIVIATIPAGLLGLLASNLVESFYDSGNYTQISQLVTLVAIAALGVVFIGYDKLFTSTGTSKKRHEFEKLSWLRALIIGASQAIAFIRGTSRSGISLLVGQAAGLSRVEAAKFSFLISIPLITATSILGVAELFKLQGTELQDQLIQALIIMVAAFVSGLFAINYLIKYLSKNGLTAFGIYRILFALASAYLIFGQSL